MALKILFALGFLDLFTFGLLVPTQGVRTLALGGTRFTVGLLTSGLALAQLITGPVVGSLSDSRGRQPMLLSTLALTLVTHLLLPFDILSVFLISRLLFGIANKTQILVKALLTDQIKPEQQGEVFGKYGALSALSLIFGPIIGGYIAGQPNGYSVFSFIVSITSIISILLVLILPEEKPKPIQNEDTSDHVLLSSFENLLNINWNLYGDEFLTKYLCESTYAIFYQTFGITILNSFGGTQIDIGYIVAFHSLMMIVFNVAAEKIKTVYFKNDNNNVIIHGLFTLIVSFVFLYFFSSYWTYVLFMIPFSYVRALVETTLMKNLLSKANENDKGTVVGAYESIMHMAGLTFPLLNGFIADSFGSSASILLCLFPPSIALVRIATKKNVKSKSR